MIGRIPPRKFKKGMELTAKWLAEVRDAAVEGSICHLGSGLKGSPTPNGWSIGLANVGRGKPVFLAKTDGVITARSGTTLGSGLVFLTSISGTTITVSSDTMTVYNYGSTVGGIATATFVVCAYDENDIPLIISVDCG